MTNNLYKIRYFKSEDTKMVADLILTTFLKHNQKDATKDGIKKFSQVFASNKANIETLKSKYKKYPISFVALKNNRIIGFTHGNKNRLKSLFVNVAFHGHGIGSVLLKLFEKTALKLGSKEIKIRAAASATTFYEKHGYKKSTGQRVHDGLFVQPMKKIF